MPLHKELPRSGTTAIEVRNRIVRNMCQNGTDIPMTKLKQFHNKSYSKPPLGSSRKDVWFALLKGLDSFSGSGALLNCLARV